MRTIQRSARVATPTSRGPSDSRRMTPLLMKRDDCAFPPSVAQVEIGPSLSNQTRAGRPQWKESVIFVSSHSYFFLSVVLTTRLPGIRSQLFGTDARGCGVIKTFRTSTVLPTRWEVVSSVSARSICCISRKWEHLAHCYIAKELIGEVVSRCEVSFAFSESGGGR
jgi:hypothetical protein